MAVDVTEARQAIQELLMPTVCTIHIPASLVSDGGGGMQEVPGAIRTSTCSFSAVRDEAFAFSSDTVAERGRYRLGLPIDIEVPVGAHVDIAGRRFRAVWTPPLSGLGLKRIVGLVEDR